MNTSIRFAKLFFDSQIQLVEFELETKELQMFIFLFFISESRSFRSKKVIQSIRSVSCGRHCVDFFISFPFFTISYPLVNNLVKNVLMLYYYVTSFVYY